MEFFSSSGQATAYSPDGVHIYTWDGRPVAYLHGNRVYGYRGQLLGWFENGWLFDRSNQAALFTAEASGGPMKPMRALKPLKGLRELRPLKGLRELPHVRPMRTMGWSPFANYDYFHQV